MINLVCKLPFQGYVKGQVISDPVLISRLLQSHDAHFVAIPANQVPQQAVSTAAAAPSAPKGE